MLALRQMYKIVKFQLSNEEFTALRSPFVQVETGGCDNAEISSQFFTEDGKKHARQCSFDTVCRA